MYFSVTICTFHICTFHFAVWIGLLWGINRRLANREREKKNCIGISTIIFPPPPAALSPTPDHGHLSPDNPPHEIGSPSVNSCPIGTGQVAKPIYSPRRTRRSPDKRRRRTSAPLKQTLQRLVPWFLFYRRPNTKSGPLKSILARFGPFKWQNPSEASKRRVEHNIIAVVRLSLRRNLPQNELYFDFLHLHPPGQIPSPEVNSGQIFTGKAVNLIYKKREWIFIHTCKSPKILNWNELV